MHGQDACAATSSNGLASAILGGSFWPDVPFDSLPMPMPGSRAPLAEIAGLFLKLGTIGFGGGLFAVGTLIAAMALTEHSDSGLALGAWGAVQATAAGLAIALGGALRDITTQLAANGSLGPALSGPATGYGMVYHAEIGLLFATLVAIGPLVRRNGDTSQRESRFGIPDFPG